MKTEEVSLHGIKWHFLDPAGSPLLAVLNESRLDGEVVKKNVKRRVLRQPGIFVKEVRYRGLPIVFKTLLGGTACQEGRINLELAKTGIPVPEVLAFGTEKKFGFIRRDLLLTREELSCKTLHAFLFGDFPGMTASEKHRFVQSFAGFMRMLHDNGVFHNDLHIGNILKVPGGSNGHGFVLLDNDRISFKKRPLTTAEKSDNLAQLLSNLWTLADRSQRFRFLKAYGVKLDREGRHFVDELETKALRHLRKISRKKARQSLENNRRFAKEKRKGFTVFYRKKRGMEEILDGFLDDPDRFLEKGEIFKAGNTVRAAKVELNGKYYFLKRFNCKGWRYQLKNAFRRSRALRSWLVCWGFRLRGIPLPQPLMCLEERRMRLLKRSYILFEFIDDGERLNGVWPELGADRRKGILARLGLMLGRLHFFGGIHGDLKWNNILVNRRGDLFLTDFDGSRIVASRNKRRKKKDLERFLVDLESAPSTKTEREFFLKCWQRWSS
ncbi:MAG: lipopolysaccharide kinase InaA family protein [Syntrophotaleaceae bacterium]